MGMVLRFLVFALLLNTVADAVAAAWLNAGQCKILMRPEATPYFPGGQFTCWVKSQVGAHHVE